MPTEAQWEYAARAGTTMSYYFSGKFADYAWYDANSGGHQHEVGQKPANDFGLHDMAGNVWEWACSDYTERYNGSEMQCSHNGKSRVLRGGSWGYIPRYLRSANHGYGSPDYRDYSYGFRLSRM